MKSVLRIDFTFILKYFNILRAHLDPSQLWLSSVASIQLLLGMKESVASSTVIQNVKINKRCDFSNVDPAIVIRRSRELKAWRDSCVTSTIKALSREGSRMVRSADAVIVNRFVDKIKACAGIQSYLSTFFVPKIACKRIQCFALLLLVIMVPFFTYAEDKPFLKLVPKTLFFEENYKNEEIRKTFEGRENRLQYFLDEITNYPEDKSEFFFDYINPEISEREFIAGKSSVYKRILKLKNIELSNKERRSVHNIDKFMATNYKTERVPAKAYLTNPHLPRPFTVSQLTTLAFNAIPNDDMHALRALIENYNLVNTKDGMGNSLLVHSIMLGKNNIARFLIHQGADLNSVNSYGVTPLMEAARSGNFEAAYMLIKYGCNVRKKDSEKKSALDYALGNDKMYALISNSMGKKR